MNIISCKIKTIVSAGLLLLLFPGILFASGKERIGTTFSARQCEYLDLDPKETYVKVLEEGFSIIRLGAYWSEIELEEGKYDFSQLDWQIDEAKKRKVPIILTVGMKAPRWPEYFIPGWIKERLHIRFGRDVAQDEFLREHTLKFIRETVTRYAGEEIVQYWQVENEPFNRIGENKWHIGIDFLKEEAREVKKLDSLKRPIVLTAATYPNNFTRFLINVSLGHDPVKECLKMGDIVGLNVYPSVGYKILGQDVYFRTNLSERKQYFSKLFTTIREEGKSVWIVELQAEPWEPGHLAYKEKKRPVTASPEETRSFVEEFREMGAGTILLWGAEYWVFREKAYNDSSWLKEMRKIIKQKTKSKENGDLILL